MNLIKTTDIKTPKNDYSAKMAKFLFKMGLFGPRLQIKLTKLAFNYYVPFWVNGVSITHINEDMSRIDVRLKSRSNAVGTVQGTMFGGSLFTFTDPFYVLILLRHIGKDHNVWDKKSSIEFISPGRSDINYSFSFTQSEIKEIVEKCKDHAPLLKNIDIELKGDDGKTVAKINKIVHIRRKMGK